VRYKEGRLDVQYSKDYDSNRTRLYAMISDIVGWIVMGAIVGGFMRAIQFIVSIVSDDESDDDSGGIIVLTFLGIVGACLGGFLASLLGLGWLSTEYQGVSAFAGASIGAVILVMIYQSYRLVFFYEVNRVGRRVGRLFRGHRSEIPRIDEPGDAYTPSSGGHSDTSGALRRTDLAADAQKSNLLQMTSQQPSSLKGTRNYDVFVSYRRQHGAAVARLISNSLKGKGKRAFIDVDDLPAGLYDEALLATVANTPNFVVVLTPHALDHTIEGQDWLRQEIAQAIQTNSNIVPVLMPDFQFPEQQTLPSDIKDLPKYQGVRYSHDYFDGMLERLIKYLRS